MAKTKESMRQVTDAAVSSIAPDKLTEAPRANTRTKPDKFIGDRPGFYRGAKIRK